MTLKVYVKKPSRSKIKFVYVERKDGGEMFLSMTPSLRRMLERQRVMQLYYKWHKTSTKSVEFKCEHDEPSAAIWQKSMPCIGARTPGTVISLAARSSSLIVRPIDLLALLETLSLPLKMVN